MKKVLLFFISVSFMQSSIAQLEEVKEKTEWTTIGELKWLGTIKAQLQYVAQARDTAFLLYLKDEVKLKNSRDMSVIKHFSIRFNSSGNTLEALKNILFSFFEKENIKNKKYDRTFQLGSTMVNVQYYPKLTNTAIMFYTKEGYTIFNKREITKLFGKAED